MEKVSFFPLINYSRVYGDAATQLYIYLYFFRATFSFVDIFVLTLTFPKR